jgi:hypothetical protein
VKEMAEEHYIVDDRIISTLSLPESCEIRIDIYEDEVVLRVGQRDWRWKRGCPDTSEAGTFI